VVEVEAVSGVYETQPFGYADQPVFWNMVVRGRTTLGVRELLGAVKVLEPALGRVASFHMGPRAIDIDILLYGEERITSADLNVPHTGLLERAFVLQPLLEIDPGIVHPVTRQRIDAIGADAAGVVRLGAAADMLPAWVRLPGGAA
jgi:2-amino-4-hydroxy-6-hydroxymethyldihydropteridine diphosphokinase